MCTLIGALGFAVSAAQSVLTFKAQQAQYNAQLAAYQANIKSAAQSYNDQTAQEGLKNQQQQVQAVDKQQDLFRESLQSKGTQLASSEGGGLSEEMLLQDIERQRADYSDMVAYNLKNEIAQSQMNMKGMWAQATTRGQHGNPGPAPSAAGMYLGMAGAALGAYNDYHVKPHQDIMTAPKYSATSSNSSRRSLQNRWYGGGEF